MKSPVNDDNHFFKNAINVCRLQEVQRTGTINSLMRLNMNITGSGADTRGVSVFASEKNS